MVDVVIRKLEQSDINSVHGYGRQIPEFKSSQDTSFWSLDALEKWAASPYDVLLVADDGMNIVGFVLSAYHVPTGKATLENLYVISRNRLKGIGENLVYECCRQLEQKGAKYICALVGPENHAIQSTLGKNGFQPTKDFLWMEKKY